MTEFNIDLLHPGGFARSWIDWFTGRQAKRGLAILYAIMIIGVLALVGDFFYETIPLRGSLQRERQRGGELQTQINKRRADIAQQRSQFQGIIELEILQVIWSEVLQALSEGIPETLWLNRVELVQPAAQPTPQAVAGAAPAPKPPWTLRLEIGTDLEPGSERLLDVARFLDELGRDRRFARKFKMEDWEASSTAAPSSAGTRGEQAKQQMTLTVSFKVAP